MKQRVIHALAVLGQDAAARQRYERGLQLDPSGPVAANNLARLHARSEGDLDIALQLSQAAYAKAPNSPEIGDTLRYIYHRKTYYHRRSRS